jgi:HSP20 family protein
MSKDDVTVDLTEHAITIQGERKHEHEEERGGYYHSERSYGSFSRTIPLPDGAMTDQAKANFKNGVLEITMPAPPATTARRLEIGGESRK